MAVIWQAVSDARCGNVTIEMAAQLHASAALQAALSLAPNPQELITKIGEFIDDSLTMSGLAKGDPNDELNTQVREIARMQAMNSLDNIRRMLSRR